MTYINLRGAHIFCCRYRRTLRAIHRRGGFILSPVWTPRRPLKASKLQMFALRGGAAQKDRTEMSCCIVSQSAACVTLVCLVPKTLDLFANRFLASRFSEK